MDMIKTAERTYYAPHGGHPGQNELLTGRAVFTEAYAIIPKGVMQDIVTSPLPFWEKTRAWIIARPLSGFAETFSQYVVEVSPGGGADAPEADPAAEGVWLGDSGRIAQILSNLLGNAVKFTDRGEVILAVDRLGERLRFTVSDTGVGFNAEARERLFRRFEQADDPKTAPLLKEMRGGDGKPKVCEKVWISSVGCLGDRYSDLSEQKGKLTVGFGASNDVKIGPEHDVVSPPMPAQRGEDRPKGHRGSGGPGGAP